MCEIFEQGCSGDDDNSRKAIFAVEDKEKICQRHKEKHELKNVLLLVEIPYPAAGGGGGGMTLSEG